MMFSATLSMEVRPICKKFMRGQHECIVDDNAKLTLHGLQQYYIKLEEKEKNRKLNELLDTLQFNQVIIFVKSTIRATELNKLLNECNFPSIAVHSGVSQDERSVNAQMDYVRNLLISRSIVSSDTRNSRNLTSVFALLPMYSDVVLISRESTSLSITIFPTILPHTFIV
jgi:hypothetical protein